MKRILILFAALLLASGRLFSQELHLDFGLGNSLSANSDPVELEARFQLKDSSTEGFLWVKAVIAPDWHIYADTQPPGGPIPTVIKLQPNQVLETTGPFTADRDPEIHEYPDVFDVPVHEVRGEIIWRAPMRLKPGADPRQAQAQVRVDGQVCEDGQGGLGRCELLEKTVAVTFVATPFQAVQGATKFRSKLIPEIELEVRATPASAAPGSVLKIQLTARPDAGWHIYEMKDTLNKDDEIGNMPTLMAFSKLDGLKEIRRSPDRAPLPPKLEGERAYYDKPVTWTIELQAPEQAPDNGVFELAGLIGYQACTQQNCKPPSGARFQLSIPVSEKAGEGAVLATMTDASFKDANELAQQRAQQLPATPDDQSAPPLTAVALLGIIGAGLLGGLILNAMPCVLPVIGLKILSLAEQAGQSRGRVLALNLWFSLGLISVFMVLATLAAFLNLGWGEQFTFTWFKVTMISVVFAMALSFLGVWEITLPGAVGGKATHELQQQEGMAGAFFKGVFTTVLATPCSGPFLGPLFAETLRQPPLVTYIIFGSIGVGMALPYLLVGLNPNLVRFLPKPGAWMDTFKQIMGFVLLATMVYLFSTLSTLYMVPTLGLVVGIWFGCWIIGRIPVTAEFPVRARGWITAVIAAALVGYAGYSVFGPEKKILPWEPYSKSALAQAQAQGKTVLVDFTAQWCLTCKWNLKQAINTHRVRKVVDKNDVVTMLADWTDKSSEIEQSLAELNSKSIPLLAIYPASRPEEVIVLRDLVRESQVVEALEQAGPSQAPENSRATVMR